MFGFRRNTPEIDVDELDRLLDQGAALVDVREGWEFRRGHVPGAIHIPLAWLPRRLDEVPRDRRVLVICQTGNRSLTATDYLLGRGFEATASVAGGTTAWARSGRAIEQGSSNVA